MNYRRLGKTGLLVSELGFGTIPVLQGNALVLPDTFQLDMDAALAVMEHAFSLGCNLFDTAIVPEYGDAEYKLGRFAEHWEPVRICILCIRWTGNMRKPCLQGAVRWTLWRS